MTPRFTTSLLFLVGVGSFEAGGVSEEALRAILDAPVTSACQS